MATGQPANPNALSSAAQASGECATRRLLREITQETANTQTHCDVFEQSQNPRHRKEANASRMNLEKAVNVLQTTTDIPESLKPRVAATISAANAVLALLLPLDEGEDIPTPSVSVINTQEAFRPIVPPHCQPNTRDVNGVTLTRDTDSDQGLRGLFSSPPLPATLVLRSVGRDGQARPASQVYVAHLSPNPASRGVERAASVLSSGSRHQDAAIAISSARQERLNERQELRKRLEEKRTEMEKQRSEMEKQRNEIEQLQLDIDNAESLERAKRLDEELEADEEVRVTLSDAVVDQWVTDTFDARSHSRAHKHALNLSCTHNRSHSRAPNQVHLYPVLLK